MPALVNIRATLLMEWGKDGWSESFVRQETTIDAAIAAARDLVDARRALLPGDVQCNVVKISDLDVYRDSRLVDVSAAPSGAYWGGTLKDSWRCVVARLEGGPQYRRPVYLHGIEDGATKVVNSEQVVTANFEKQVLKFLNFLVSNHWGFMARDKDPKRGALLIKGTIIGGTQDATTKNNILTAPVAHNLVTGDKVIVRGVKGMREVNGIHQVNVDLIPGVDFRLLETADERPYLGGGFWRLLLPTFVVPDRYSVVAVSKRNPGRPFDSHRGRRSTRRP